MEVITEFSTLIANLGVPVACMAVTFYLWYNETKTHKEEVTQLRDALANNTMVMQKLLDKLSTE